MNKNHIFYYSQVKKYCRHTRLQRLGDCSEYLEIRPLCEKDRRPWELATALHLGCMSRTDRGCRKMATLEIRQRPVPFPCLLGPWFRLDTRPQLGRQRHDWSSGNAHSGGWRQDSALPCLAEELGHPLQTPREPEHYRRSRTTRRKNTAINCHTSTSWKRC